MRRRSLKPRGLSSRALHAKPIKTYTLQSYRQRQERINRLKQYQKEKNKTEVEEDEEIEND